MKTPRPLPRSPETEPGCGLVSSAVLPAAGRAFDSLPGASSGSEPAQGREAEELVCSVSLEGEL